MTSIELTVKGMSCMGCVNSIERRLAATPGVLTASVELETGVASVTFDENVTDAYSLEKVIESLGFDVVYSMGREKSG
jgi:copper chaperone CopZ